MALLLRHPVILFAVFAACFGTVSVFTFAKPDYHRRFESRRVDFSKQEHHSVAEVRRAFSEHGIRLGHSTDAFGVTVLTTRMPYDADALQVAVAPRRGRGAWGPELDAYDERFDNLLVTYGGNDEALIRRVDAAVDELR